MTTWIVNCIEGPVAAIGEKEEFKQWKELFAEPEVKYWIEPAYFEGVTDKDCFSESSYAVGEYK